MGILFDHKKICCLIITYNPDIALYDLINVIKNKVGSIIIVDNNSEAKTQIDLTEIASQSDFITLILNNENFGIAKALNQGVILANKMNYDWVLTFDQDTKPFDNIVDILAEVYELYPDKKLIGAIGVNALKTNSEKYYMLSSQEKYCERDYLITAGCLISINAFNRIGGFREDFFIDNVDLEYSLRLKQNGMVSLITYDYGMMHDAGAPIAIKILGMRITSTNHNIIRRYYMARNHIILSKEYFLKFPYFILKTNFFFMLSIIKILLVENDITLKIQASFRGLKDGIIFKSKYNSQILNNCTHEISEN